MVKPDPNNLGFFEHMEEMRGRIIKSLLLWLVVLGICFYYVEPIFAFLAQPMARIISEGPVFAAFDIKEPFMANLKAAFWVSVILSSGIFFYHTWAFISPGLERREARFAIPFLTFMTIFFFVGCWFSFTQVFPYALDYLVAWNADSLNAYTRSSYLSLLFAFVMGMGASFELPLAIFFLAKIGLVTPSFLMRQLKFAILIIFIFAAIITPTPDPWMQTFLAIPMILLYLLGVAAAYIVTRKRRRQEAIEAAELAAAAQPSQPAPATTPLVIEDKPAKKKRFPGFRKRR